MKSWYSTLCHPICQAKILNQTASTIAAYQHSDYLSHLNYKLVNQINSSQTQKNFYRNKLSYQYRNHSSELQQAYRIINQKNNQLLNRQEIVNKCKKQFRESEDNYITLKRKSQEQKLYYERQMENMKKKCDEKVKEIQDNLRKQFQVKINKRVQEINRQCQNRINLYKHQINQLTSNATQLTHQLKLLQDQHRDVLLKNDLIIQQSINRQLRKRDYQAQNNYLRDVTQYQTLLKDKRQMKQQLQNLQAKLENGRKRIKQLEALLEMNKTKYDNLLQAFQSQKLQNKSLTNKNYNLNSNLADTAEVDTNTQQLFVPIVMPVDLDLISEIVGLKQFVVQKIVETFLQFFNKTAITDPKKKSLSLTTFKNSLQLLKQTNPQHKILLYIQANLDRIIKVYCPTMSYSRQNLTIKDDFIKRTLIQCQTIANPMQKLYRILQLINRLKHPITHLKSQISAGQLRMVEIKFLVALKKVFLQ